MRTWPCRRTTMLHWRKNSLLTPSWDLAGGFIHEDSGQGFRSRSTNHTQSVAHAIQLFRRQCFEEIGGYIALPYGGPDWVAELMARRLEWRVEAFPDLPVEHYRPSASAGGFIRGCYRQDGWTILSVACGYSKS